MPSHPTDGPLFGGKSSGFAASPPAHRMEACGPSFLPAYRHPIPFSTFLGPFRTTLLDLRHFSPKTAADKQPKTAAITAILLPHTASSLGPNETGVRTLFVLPSANVKTRPAASPSESVISSRAGAPGGAEPGARFRPAEPRLCAESPPNPPPKPAAERASEQSYPPWCNAVARIFTVGRTSRRRARRQ